MQFNLRRKFTPKLLLLLLLSLCCFDVSVAKRIQLQSDGRYSDVLVAISDDVSEDWGLIDRIKQAFSSASMQLSIATQFHQPSSFAFGDVRILIPISWNGSQADEEATWETQDQASFRVGTRGSKIPFTVQPRSCGQPGDFVNLHAEHLNDTSAAVVGKELLHEFARYRWGLFPEFTGDNGPHHYKQNGEIKPIICSHGIKGQFMIPDTKEVCEINRVNLELDPRCRFVPDEVQTTNASLMYAHYLASVNQFCSQGQDGEADSQHNRQAPTEHNRRCRRKSARSVMLQHADFKNSLLHSSNHNPADVNFTVVQRPLRRELVTVMDVSGSMRGQPLTKMKIGVVALVSEKLDSKFYCGMNAFNTRVRILRNLTQLSNDGVRREFADLVNRLSAGGGTAIGDGLAVGMEMLGVNLSNPTPNNKGSIMLLTDGQQNSVDRYSFNQSIALVKRTSIAVYTIGFGNAADKRLEALSRDTGGRAFFVTFKTAANDMIEAMASMARDIVPTTEKPIDIFSSPVAEGFIQKVKVDKSVAKSLTIRLTSTRVNEIGNNDLIVVSPSNMIIDKRNTSLYVKDSVNGVITITLPGEAEVGEWTISDSQQPVQRPKRSTNSKMPASNTMSLTVSSKPADAAPIILDGSVSDSKVQLNEETQIAVYASLMQGAELLHNANISASIESDNGIEAVILLKDDGVGADTRKNDGIFSGLVPSNVQMRQEYNVRLLCTDPVDRVATAGKFEIVSVDNSSIWQIPPSSIQDLISEIDLPNKTIQLTWTAVGDQRMDGMASQYYLKVCHSLDDLENSTQSTDCSILNSTAQPQAAGQQMQDTVTAQQLGDTQETMYIGVFAQNSLGISSEMSNVVAVQLSLPKNIIDFIKPTPPPPGGASSLSNSFTCLVAMATAVIYFASD